MSDVFLGEVRMFGFAWAPQNWALCDGALLAVSQNDALFSLLGTIYGGDGRTTFGLPDLRGRTPVHAGSGPGLTNVNMGQKGGAENVTLTTNQLPAHNHLVNATNEHADQTDPGDKILAFTVNPTNPAQAFPMYTTKTTLRAMNSAAIGNTGGTQSHNNMQYFQVISYCIALFGIYPSRH